MRKVPLILLGIFFAFLLSIPLFSYIPPSGRYEIFGKRISYDWKKMEVTIEGNAEITGEGYRIIGDKLVYNYAKGEVRSFGRVVVEKGDMSIEGMNMWLNLQRGVGYLENASYFSKKLGFYGSGKRVVRLSNGDIWIEDGSFTTCNPIKPLWKVKGKEVVIKEKGYALIRGMSVYLKGKKVLWLPYGFLPTKRERKTGFLIPKYGSSTRSGFYIEDQFFYAISDSSDMTFLGGYEGRRGVKLGAEFRYNFGPDKNGIIQALYSSGNKKWETKEDRWGVKGSFGWKWRKRALTLLGDFMLVSDNDFISDFSGDFLVYPTNKRFVDNSLFLRKEKGSLGITGGLVYLDRLDGSNEGVFSYYPEVTLSYQKDFMGFRTQGILSVVNFSRNKGYEGWRGNLSVGFNRDVFAKGVAGRVFFGGKGSYYELSDYKSDSEFSGLFYGGIEARKDFVYSGSFGEKPVLTVIVPFVSGFYVSSRGSLPEFDGSDRSLEGFYLLYGLSLSSYLSGVRAVSFRIYQSARLDGEMGRDRDYEISLDFLTERDLRVFERTTGRKFSEIVAELSLTPFSSASLSASGSLDPYNGLFRRGDVSLKLGYGPFYFGGGYYYMRDVVEEISFGASLSLWSKLFLSGSYSYRISSHSGDVKGFSMTYAPDCYSVTGYVKTTSRPNETRFGFVVGVKAFGGVKTFGISP